MHKDWRVILTLVRKKNKIEKISPSLAHLSQKAQVSLSDQNLFVVRRRCRCCCRKLFTFSSSPPEPLSQFQPNLAQCILG